MTDPTSGTAEPPHPTAEVLAAAGEGILPDLDARRVTAHAASCTECAETLASLVAVGRILQHAPTPPMPTAVSDRLQAVIRTESTRRASGIAENEARAAAVEAAKRTALGTFGQNPTVGRKAPIRTDDLAEK